MISVTEQVVVFVQSCLLGVGLGLLYDMFRILRMAVRTNAIGSFVEDLLYFIICTILGFSFIIIAADGQIRVYLIIGMVLGAVLYFFSLSVIVLSVAKPVIKGVKRFFRFIYRITLRPICSCVLVLHKKSKRKLEQMSTKRKAKQINRKNILKTDMPMVYNHCKAKKNKKMSKQKTA